MSLLSNAQKRLPNLCLVFLLFLWWSSEGQQLAYDVGAAAKFQPIFNQNEAIPSSKGREMLRYMNLQANPCLDFYEFACGNWDKYHELPRSVTSVRQQQKYIDEQTPLRTLENQVNVDLQHLLNEQNTLDEESSEHKVKDFYKSCLNAVANGQEQQAFFSRFIQANGGCPAVPGLHWEEESRRRYDWQRIVISLSQAYGMNILIGMDVDLNLLNANESSIYFGEPSTLIPGELCSAEGTQTVSLHDIRYDEIKMKVANDLKSWLTISLDEALRVAVDIVNFEYALCRGMQLNQTVKHGAVTTHLLNSLTGSNVYENYARRTLNDFTHRFNDTIDFEKFVLASYGTGHGSKPVFMRSEPYFRHLIKTVEKVNISVIANYIIYRGLSALSFPSEDRKSQRSYFCVQLAKRHFPETLGYMYYRKYANVVVKNEVDAIFDKIKDGFETSFDEVWLSDVARRLGREKLSAITLHLPKYDEKENLANLRLDRNKYWDNLGIVLGRVRGEQLSRLRGDPEKSRPANRVQAFETRVLYRPEFKRIEMGWALIQQPFFHEYYPKAIKYAVIGQQIAAALATGFNEINWTADLYGFSNWDYKTEREYFYRMDCFRRQLSNYLYNDPAAFRNSTTLRELIATTSGLNVAFEAYLLWLDFLNPRNDFEVLRKETLPGLNLSNTQLYFLTYAQAYCHYENISYVDREVARYSPLQRHTIKRWMVNGPVANSFEFSREFGCTQGLEMNPADKCIIY